MVDDIDSKNEPLLGAGASDSASSSRAELPGAVNIEDEASDTPRGYEPPSLNDEAADPVASAGSIKLAVAGDPERTVSPLPDLGVRAASSSRSSTPPITDDVRMAAFMATLGITFQNLNEAGINEDALARLLGLQGQKRSRFLRWLMLEGSLQKYVMLPFIKSSVIHKPGPRILQLANVSSGDMSEDDDDGLDTALDLDTTTGKGCAIHLKPKGQSLIIENASALKKLYAIRGFLQEGGVMLEKIWFFYLLSFMIQDFHDYYAYPDERFGDTPLKILLAQSDYERLLSKSIASLVVWPILFGVPLVRGLVTAYKRIKGVSRYLDLKALTDELEKAYKLHSGGVWHHMVSWLLPFKSASEKLEAVLQTIVWDGRISLSEKRELFWDGQLNDSQRLEAFKTIQRLAREGRQLSQWYGMGALADITYSVDYRDLARLRNLNIQDRTIRELLRIEVDAYETLRELTQLKRNQESDLELGRIRQGLRQMTAHYLLWALGKPESYALQPLFYTFKALRFYIKVRLLVTLIQGIQIIIDERNQRLDCEDKGRLWVYRTDAESFLCSSCGDAPVPWQRLEDPQQCIDEMLGTRKTPEALAVLFKDVDFSNVIRLDFRHQVGFELERDDNRHDDKDLDKVLLKVLPIISESNVSLEQLIFSPPDISNYKLPNAKESTNIIITSDTLDVMTAFIQKTQPVETNMDFIRINADNEVAYMNLLKQLPFYVLRLSLRRNEFRAEHLTGFFQSLSESSMEILDLGGNKLGNDGVKYLSTNLPLHSLQILILRYNNVGPDGAKSLARALPASSLQELSLEGNRIDSASAISLSGGLPSSSLHTLNLVKNQVGVEGATALGSSLKNSTLQTLILTTNEIGAEGAKGLGDGLQYSSLKTLELGDNNMGDEGIKNLSANLPMSSLQALDVSGNKFTAEGVKSLSNHLSASLLQSLDISNNGIGAEGIGYLSDVLHATSLQSLYSRLNLMGDQGAKTLGEVLPRSSLRTLDLRINEIGDDGVNGLSKGLPGSSLEKLILGENKFADKGAESLSNGLLYASFLQSLDLDGNKIAAKGAKSLSDVLPNISLTSLNLGTNSIGDEGAKSLGEVLSTSSLNRLDVRDNQIGDEGVKLLGEGLFPCSLLQQLDLTDNKVGKNGAIALSKIVIKNNLVQTRAPWIYYLDPDVKVGYHILTSKSSMIESIELRNNVIEPSGVAALCDVYFKVGLSFAIQDNPGIDGNIENPCQMSAAISLKPAGPYILTYRLMMQGYKGLNVLYVKLIGGREQLDQEPTHCYENSSGFQPGSIEASACFYEDGSVYDMPLADSATRSGLIPACRNPKTYQAPTVISETALLDVIQQASLYSFSLAFMPALARDVSRWQGASLRAAQRVGLGASLGLMRYHSGSITQTGISAALGSLLYGGYKRVGLSDSLSKRGAQVSVVLFQLGLAWPTTLGALLTWSGVVASGLASSTLGSALETHIAERMLELKDEEADAVDYSEALQPLLERLDSLEAQYHAFLENGMDEKELTWLLWGIENYRNDIDKLQANNTLTQEEAVGTLSELDLDIKAFEDECDRVKEEAAETEAKTPPQIQKAAQSSYWQRMSFFSQACHETISGYLPASRLTA